MAKVIAISSKGPNGEEPNVHACAVFYQQGRWLRISAFVTNESRHTFEWRPGLHDLLTGFELQAPDNLVVREILIGREQILNAPRTVKEFAPRGHADVSASVCWGASVRLEFGE